MAARGTRLLRAKREVLAGELFRLAREVLAGRTRLEAALREARRALELASALQGVPALASLASAAGREIPVEVVVRRVWGVPTAAVSAPPVVRDAGARGVLPASAGLACAEAARTHEVALETLLRIATRELHLARLGEEIRETSRRINALEQLLLPALGAEQARIEGALEEQAREDAVRLKRFRARRGSRREGA